MMAVLLKAGFGTLASRHDCGAEGAPQRKAEHLALRSPRSRSRRRANRTIARTKVITNPLHLR